MIDKDIAFVPNDVKENFKPIIGNVYINYALHEAHHHYLKVITTNVDGLSSDFEDLRAYQTIQNSQLAYYKAGVVPGTKLVLRLYFICLTMYLVVLCGVFL